MKFGIFFEISVPRPWDADAEKTVYDRCIEHYFTNVIAAGYDVSHETAWTAVRHISILHPHGVVGEYLSSTNILPDEELTPSWSI